MEIPSPYFLLHLTFKFSHQFGCLQFWPLQVVHLTTCVFNLFPEVFSAKRMWEPNLILQILTSNTFQDQFLFKHCQSHVCLHRQSLGQVDSAFQTEFSLESAVQVNFGIRISLETACDICCRGLKIIKYINLSLIYWIINSFNKTELTQAGMSSSSDAIIPLQ